MGSFGTGSVQHYTPEEIEAGKHIKDGAPLLMPAEMAAEINNLPEKKRLPKAMEMMFQQHYKDSIMNMSRTELLQKSVSFVIEKLTEMKVIQ